MLFAGQTAEEHGAARLLPAHAIGEGEGAGGFLLNMSWFASRELSLAMWPVRPTCSHIAVHLVQAKEQTGHWYIHPARLGRGSVGDVALRAACRYGMAEEGDVTTGCDSSASRWGRRRSSSNCSFVVYALWRT